MSKVNAIYHIVINTYQRQMTINNDHREDLYRFIWKLIINRKCVLYRIGGIPNHVHLLIDLHPEVPLSTLMRDIKQLSSKWAKQSGFFPQFIGWGKEYAAFTCQYSNKTTIIHYINNQQNHHKAITFETEFRSLFSYEGYAWKDEFLT